MQAPDTSEPQSRILRLQPKVNRDSHPRKTEDRTDNRRNFCPLTQSVGRSGRIRWRGRMYVVLPLWIVLFKTDPEDFVKEPEKYTNAD